MEDNEIKEQFEELYKSKIRPQALRLEPYRLEQKKKYDACAKIYIIALLFIICSITLLIIGSQTNNTQLAVIGFLVFFGGIIIFITTSGIQTNIANKYRQKVKTILFYPILSIFGDFSLTNDEILSLEEIQYMGLYYDASSKTDDDIIIGEYKNSPIILYETKLTHREKTGKSHSTITDFRGLVIKFKVNKNFNGITVASQELTYDKHIKTIKEMAEKNPDLFSPSYAKMIDNGVSKTLLKVDKIMTKHHLKIVDGKLNISLSLNMNKTQQHLQRVHIEDSEFDKNYDIYSNNQEEARYLITPSFIEKLKIIQSLFLVYSVDFVFKDGFLYLFLNGSSSILDTIKSRKTAKKYKINAISEVDSNGFFEIGNIYTPLSDKEIFNDLFKELFSIFSIVDCITNDENDKL